MSIFETPDQIMSVDHINIPKLRFVTPWLLRGGQPNKSSLSELANMGVRSVVNLRWSSDALWKERKWIIETGMSYFVIPLTYVKSPTRAEIMRFLNILDNPDNYPIFVHCQHGVDRTGMMIAIWRIARQNWTAEEAYEEMRNLGFHKVRMYHFKLAVFDFADKWERWKKRGGHL